MVEPTPSSMVTYQWNTGGCYNNSKFRYTCFPHDQCTQNVTAYVIAEDAGTITCTATFNNISITSDPFTLRISGEQLASVLCNGMYCVCCK